ncbi:unnamed protein product, partial [Coregonus sp. 'balchen']
MALRADSAKMTQREMREPHYLPTRKKSTSLSSPSTARRLYRNLSGKFRVGNLPGLEDSEVSGQGDKERLRKSAMYSLEELDLNTPNSEGLLPLDMAIMTNNIPMARLLLHAGAKESPHFVSLEGRAVHLATLVLEAEERVGDLQAQMWSEGPREREATDHEMQLKAWDSSSCLRVDFQEPLSVNSAVVTKYK